MIYSSSRPHCYRVVCASATNVAAWLRHTTDYCAFLLERGEPHGVPSPCGHSFMMCATDCLTFMPLFLDITDVSNKDHSFKTDRSPIPLFHVVQYGDDIIGQELNINKKVQHRSWHTAKCNML